MFIAIGIKFGMYRESNASACGAELVETHVIATRTPNLTPESDYYGESQSIIDRVRNEKGNVGRNSSHGNLPLEQKSN